RAIRLDVDYLSESDVRRRFVFDRPAALLSRQAARVDPVALTTALIRAALDRGLRAFAQTQIETYDFDRGGGGITLTSSAHRCLRADHVIFATGYETPEFLKNIDVKLKSTYAIAARCDARSLPTGTGEFPLVWESGSPYFYVRTDGPSRIIAGGEDDDLVDPAIRDARIPQKAATLAKKLATLFPHLSFEVDCAWAGTFAQTPDGLPYIGPHREFPRGLFALGYGGNGITFGLIAARLLRDRILGINNPDADLFRFDRR
ncbi:MAG TPA: FAD-binding oxidoreductase, partial [Tepidisphaeraceae bacterium]